MSANYGAEVSVGHPELPNTRVNVSVSIGLHGTTAASAALFGRMATLCFETGACRVQTYSTAEKLRALAAMFAEAADALETQMEAA